MARNELTRTDAAAAGLPATTGAIGATGANRNDVAMAALGLVETYLRVTRAKPTPDELVGLITGVQGAALALADGVMPGLPQARPSQALLPAPATGAGDAPLGGGEPAPAPAPLPAAFAPGRLDDPFPGPGETLPAPAKGRRPSRRSRAWRIPEDAEVWPGIPAEKREKFAELCKLHGVPRDPITGIPMPRRPKELLISPDQMNVADPISGEYFAMLKRRFETHYGLTHADVLDMFHLTELELPKTGPGFSDSKRRAAFESGLGHHRSRKVA